MNKDELLALGLEEAVAEEILSDREAVVEEYERKLAALSRESRIEVLLSESGARNKEVVRALLKDGEDLDEQIERLKSQKDTRFLFEGEKRFTPRRSAEKLPETEKSELEAKLSFKIKKTSEPEVLIVHTHATERYMEEKRDYYTVSDAFRTTDNNKNITHIGEIIAKRLTDAGIGVIHDRTQHDYPSYTGSYSRSEKTIKEYLAKYPSIKIVLDIHRDSITVNENDRTRPVAEIDGKRAAQVMLLMGSESGSVKNFPNWRENFRLGVKLQQTMEVMYPGLARPMVLASKLYNQNLTTGSMLLEIGTESNLTAEAEYTGELVGNALVSLINTLG